MVILKEYNYLTKSKHKISNLYMLPKIYDSKRINEIIQKEQCEYINIEESIIVEVCHTGISETLHIIMEPLLEMISYIAKDSKIDFKNFLYLFDFKNRLDKHCPYETALSTCDIKSLYSNI